MNFQNYRMDEHGSVSTYNLWQKIVMLTQRVTWIMLALFLVSSSRGAYPQSGQAALVTSVNDQTQAPIPGAGHNYQHLLGETVNYSNGSVNLKISFPVRKGRGITLPLKLTYNSGSVNQVDTLAFSGNTPAWDDPISDPGPHGWDSGFPVRATVQLFSVNQPPNGNTQATYIPCNYQTGMTFTDMDGVTHDLYVFAQQPASQPPATIPANQVYACTTAFTQPPTGDGQVVATINPAQAAVNLASSNSTFSSVPFTVMDKNGTTYSFQPTTMYPTGSGGYFIPTSISDRNGNQINVSSGIDTLGLPISSVSGSGSTQTVTVNDLTFTETWGTENVNYNAAINGGEESQAGTGCQPWPSTAAGTTNVSGSRSILSSILLPNSQSYSFYYGANNPNDSSILNNFGLLNQVIYPDGGWIKYTWGLPPALAGTGATQYNEAVSFGSTVANINDQTETVTYYQTTFGCVWQYQTPVLLKRQVSFDGKTVAQVQQFQYSTAWQYDANGISNGWTQKVTTVTTTDNLRGGISSKTVYTYSPYYVPAQPLASGVNANLLPLEDTITYYDWGQTTPLKTTQKQWLDQFNLSSETTTYSTANGPRVSGTVYKYISGLCTNILLLYNQSLNISTNPVQSLVYLSEQDDYDYGNGQLGLLSKKTIYNYQCFNSPFPNATPPITTIPPQISGITIEDGSGTIKAATRYGFDGTSITSLTSNPVQHGLNYVSGPSVRGNLTSATKCSTLPSSATASCSGPTVTYTYDYSGQPSSMTDPKGNTTALSFTGSTDTGNTNAYLMNITYADHLQNNFTYNYTLGYLTSATDQNNQETTYTYNTNAGCPSIPDTMYRLSEVNYPDKGITEYCYQDSILTATKNVLLYGTSFNTTNEVSTSATNDGMGHTILTQQSSDPDGQTSVATTYDGEGLVFSTSNPYRGSSSSGVPTVNQYYDALGRKIETQEQDGTSFLQWGYNGIKESSSGVVPTPTYASSQLGSVAGSARPGTWVDFTDENGNNWQRTSDVFGNLLEVMEPNGTGQTAAMETDYSYDALNNLTSVVQNGGSSGSSGARRRQFSYDNLSELLSAFNPETGTIGYAYDLNGNVQTKTDARQIVTTYGYDSRNRLLSKTYQSDATGTPASCYQYGETPDPTYFTGGRLINAWTQTSQTCTATPSSYLTRLTRQNLPQNLPAYDPMGRLKEEQQSTLGSQATGVTYLPQYSYDLAGNLSSWTDGITPSPTAPTGTKLTFTAQFCGAGRPQIVSSNWNDLTHPVTLFSPTVMPSTICGTPSTPQYEPFGGLMNAAFGSGLTFSRTYDMKMRVSSELDQGNGTLPATPSSATVTITGAEQSQ